MLKPFLHGVRKVLCVPKAHMSPSSLQGTTASEVIAAGVFLVSILQASEWNKVVSPARHYFTTYSTIPDWHQDSVQHAVQGLTE